MAVSSLGPNYSDADYMQRDGVDGSGSGGGPDFEDEEREDDYVRGSGSGDGPTGEGLCISTLCSKSFWKNVVSTNSTAKSKYLIFSANVFHFNAEILSKP